MARKVAKSATKAKASRKPKESRTTPDNPRFNLNDPEAWDYLAGGQGSASGERVTKRKGLTLSPVWQAVNLISGDTAKLPLEVYKTIKKDGRITREERYEHPAYRLVNRQANRETSAFVFWRRMMVHLLMWNRTFAFIDRDDEGRPRELFNLLPDRTTPERLSGRAIYDNTKNRTLADELDGQLVFTTEVDGNLKTLLPSQVLYIQGINFDSIESCDLVDSARDSWGLAIAQQNFASKFFANGARVSGILEVPLAMSKKGADNLEEGFRKQYTGNGNWFKTVILRDGAKFHSTSVAPEEGQMAESREQSVRDVARWFNLAPSKLGLSDSVSYNSKAEDNQNYYDSTLSPHLTGITAECWMKLLSEREQKDHFFEHDTDQLLRLDTLKRFQMYEIGRRIGVYSPNDIRAKENEKPREGGDVYQDVMQGAAPKDAPKDGADNGDTGKQKQKARALDRVVWEFARRARTKAETKSAFLAWVQADFPAVVEAASHALEGDAAGAEAFLSPILADFRRISPDLSPEMLQKSVENTVQKYENRSAEQWISEHYSRDQSQ